VKQPNRDDSKILEDLGLLCEEADVSKLDDRLMDVLLRSDPRDEDVCKESTKPFFSYLYLVSGKIKQHQLQTFVAPILGVMALLECNYTQIRFIPSKAHYLMAYCLFMENGFDVVGI
jgi:hypothetical protein